MRSVYNGGLVKKIFDEKKRYHRERAKLPIEEKIWILVEEGFRMEGIRVLSL